MLVARVSPPRRRGRDITAIAEPLAPGSADAPAQTVHSGAQKQRYHSRVVDAAIQLWTSNQQFSRRRRDRAEISIERASHARERRNSARDRVRKPKLEFGSDSG